MLWVSLVLLCGVLGRTFTLVLVTLLSLSMTVKIRLDTNYTEAYKPDINPAVRPV
jgi:hypothetical protein